MEFSDLGQALQEGTKVLMRIALGTALLAASSIPWVRQSVREERKKKKENVEWIFVIGYWEEV